MTRNAEHIPSPQSVVVPVELMTLSLKAAEQFIVNGVEAGYVRLPDYDDDPAHSTLPLIRDALALLSVAPAPSSLAGGKVSRAVACVGQVANGAQVAEVYGGEWCLDPALEFRAHLRAILAALSPEAPAREGVVMAASDAPMWADGIATDGENVAMAQKAETDHGGHYWAVDGGNGGLDWEPTHFISLDALTPRHEAPAEGVGEEIEQIIYESFGLGSHSDAAQDAVRRITEYLRARSSAPEAREGEAVTITLVESPPPLPGVPSFAIRKWDNHGLTSGTHRLYTHPAAPSADKLRIAVEALNEAHENLIQCGDHFGAGQCSDAVSLISTPDALKAEGAK